jgi:hypothetical protein
MLQVSGPGTPIESVLGPDVHDVIGATYSQLD